MKNLKEIFSSKVLKWFKFIFLILIVLFFILIVFRTFNYLNVQKIEDRVVKIHNTKLSIDDVMGKNLPIDPGLDSDKTVQGIDANNNGIRDDVELAIFEEYPNSAKTRAVLLQYALALQMMSTQSLINEEIATSIMQEKSRAYICIGNILTRNDENEDIMNKYFEDGDRLRSFVEDKQLNTLDRISNDKDFYKKVRSYSDLDGICDIDLSKLPN